MLAALLEHPLLVTLAFLAGAASAEGVRRTFNKFTGGRFFGKKPA